MSETTLTVVFGGEVPLDLFAEGIQRFRQLIEELTSEIAGSQRITWVVDDLAIGSASTTIRGVADEPEAVSRVVGAFSNVGRALQNQLDIPYSVTVVRAAQHLTEILNGKVTSIEFETDYETSLVMTAPFEDRLFVVPIGEVSSRRSSAFGAIEGRLATLKSRGRRSFTLYDVVDDHAITCILGAGQDDLVREAWDHRVIVEGWISREPAVGRPVEINPVESVTILPDFLPGSFRNARGVSPVQHGTESVEDTIRRLRDV